VPESPLVRKVRQGPAGILLLNRPEKANAYTDALLEELAGGLREMADDPEVRAVILGGGDSPHFCAGADLDEMSGRQPAEALALRSRALFAELAALPKPTLAAVAGACVAGGLELALACDLRLAARGARFAFPETGLGLIPAAGGTLRLPQVIGVARAKEMILFGRELSADEAWQAGLVTEVVEPDQLMGRALWWAQAAARRDPLALRLAKQALHLALPAGPALEYEGAAQALLYGRRKEARL
jgi:enoyl-CoA hydratase